MNFKNCLQLWIEKTSKNPTQFANFIGEKPQTIFNWLQRETPPTPKKFKNLLDKLNLKDQSEFYEIVKQYNLESEMIGGVMDSKSEYKERRFDWRLDEKGNAFVFDRDTGTLWKRDHDSGEMTMVGQVPAR